MDLNTVGQVLEGASQGGMLSSVTAKNLPSVNDAGVGEPTLSSEQMYSDFKNYMIKNKTYNDDYETIIGVNSELGLGIPKEVEEYQKLKEAEKKAFIDKQFALQNELNKDAQGIEHSPILFGGPTFTVGEAAFETGFQAIMNVIPESAKEDYPVLSTIGGVLATIAAGIGGKKGLDTFASKTGDSLMNAFTKDFDKAMLELDELVKKGDLDPKVLEDMGLTQESIKGAKTVDTKSNPYSNIDTTKPLDIVKVTTLPSTFEEITQQEVKQLADDAEVVFKAEEPLTVGVSVPKSVSNKVDVIAENAPKNNKELLQQQINSFNITKFENTLPDSRKVTRVKLKKISKIVDNVGYDKSIRKFLDEGDVDGALLRAEEIKANRGTEGIQRPGTADYKPLTNDYVYAHAAPEIAGGLLGVSIEASSQWETGEWDTARLAGAFLVGAGSVYGSKYLWEKVKKGSPTDGNLHITNETTTKRLNSLRETRLDEVEDLITEIKRDLTTAAQERGAKLQQTLQVLENVKATLKETADLSTLLQNVDEASIRAAMKKAGSTIVKVEKPTVQQTGKIAQNIATKSAPKVTELNLERINNAEELESVFNSVEDVYSQTFKKDKVTFKETEKLADSMGFTVKELNNLYEDTGALHARLLAARNFRDTLATDILKLSNEIEEVAAKGGNYTEKAIELQNKAAQFAAVHAMVTKSNTEVARALSANRITSRAKSNIEFINNTEVLNALGSGSLSKVRKVTKKLAHKQSLEAHDHLFVKQMIEPNAINMIEELYLNALLSNPVTHLKNAVSNMFTGVNSIITKYAEVATGAFAKDGVTLREANAYFAGYLSSIKEAWAMAKMSAKKGEPIVDWIQKEEGMQYRAISKDSLPGLGEFGNHLGNIINTPFKALMISDEFFKVMAYRAEMNASAVRHALDDAAAGRISKDAVGESINKIKDTKISSIIDEAMNGTLEGNLLAIHRQSLENARFLTHTKPLGEFGQAIQKVHNLPGGKLLIPFIRTPVNIVKYVGKYTPGLNLIAESERANLRAGGRAGAKTMARMAVGSALYTTGWMLAAEGTITGKLSSNYGEVESMKAAGIQPDSILIGGKYYPTSGIDTPFAFFKIMADLYTAIEAMDFRDKDLLDEVEEIGAALTLAFGQYAENSTWMSSVADIIALTQEPKNPTADKADQFENFVANKIAGFIPSVVYGITREVSDNMVEARGLVDALMKKIPGLADDMPVKYDMYGQPVEHTGGLYIKGTTPSGDPVKSEIARIKYRGEYFGKTIKGVEVPPEVLSFLKKSKGEKFYSYASQLINSDTWSSLQDGTPQVTGSKELALQKLDRIAKTLAIEEAKSKFPEFGKKLKDKELEILNTRYLGQ